nr:DUF1294 domain-containing protein [Maliibacterium massiliense]
MSAHTLYPLLAGTLALVNLAAFALMGWDKRCARKGAWRVRERTLLWACALFGAPGGYLGMRLFHHKTQKRAFALGVPLMALVQVALAIVLVWHLQTP